MADNKPLRPQPWKAHQGENTNWWWVILDAEGDEIGSCDGGFEELEASLFADSPTMLDILRDSLGHVPDDLKDRIKSIVNKYEVPSGL